MKPNGPEDQTFFDWLLFTVAAAALLLFTVADFKQAGTQHALFSVARTVR
jgi:hypothetical protein